MKRLSENKLGFSFSQIKRFAKQNQNKQDVNNDLFDVDDTSYEFIFQEPVPSSSSEEIEVEHYSNFHLSTYESDISRQQAEDSINNFLKKFTRNQSEKFSAYSNRIMIETQQHKQAKEKILSHLTGRRSFWILIIMIAFIFKKSLFMETYSFTAQILVLIFLRINQFLQYDVYQIISMQKSVAISAFTSQPIHIMGRYSVNEFLDALKKENSFIGNQQFQILEQENKKQLKIIQLNNHFLSIYVLQIRSEKDFSVSVYTDQFAFLPSIIDNLQGNFEIKKGIWMGNHSSNFISKVLSPFEGLVYLCDSYLNGKNTSQYKELIEDLPFDMFYAILLTIVNEFVIDYSDKIVGLNLLMYLALLYSFLKLTFRFLRTDYLLFEKIQEIQTNDQKENQSYYMINPIKINSQELQYFIPSNIIVLDIILIALIGLIGQLFSEKDNSTSFPYFILIVSYPVLRLCMAKPLIQMMSLFKIPFACIDAIVLFIKEDIISNQSNNQLKKDQKQISFAKLNCVICKESELTILQQSTFKCKNKHFFHQECIVRWKKSRSNSANNKCPTCRVSLYG